MESREQFVAAAQSYLDLDALADAAGTLSEAKALSAGQADDPLRGRIAAVESILDFRRSIPYLGTGEMKGASRPPTPAPAEGVDPGFLARQRFKMLADLAQRSAALGGAETAERLYLEALPFAREQNSLSGTGDVLRLDRIRTSVEKEVVIDSGNVSDSGTQLDRSPFYAKGKVWTLPETGGGAARQFAWSSDLLLAAKVAAVAESGAKDVSVTVKNSEVTVAAEPEKSGLATMTVKRLEDAGVKEVSPQVKIRSKSATTPP